jgi:hypothetical protein
MASVGCVRCACGVCVRVVCAHECARSCVCGVTPSSRTTLSLSHTHTHTLSPRKATRTMRIREAGLFRTMKSTPNNAPNFGPLYLRNRLIECAQIGHITRDPCEAWFPLTRMAKQRTLSKSRGQTLRRSQSQKNSLMKLCKKARCPSALCRARDLQRRAAKQPTSHDIDAELMLWKKLREKVPRSLTGPLHV